ncbi:MAG: DUF4129 domain-containing transglutaminase family protein [Tepidiformaceae bacterium]
MAELNLPMNRSAGRRIGSAAISAPRLLMSWEDWLTFGAAAIAFLAVAASIQQAGWVNNMPAVAPTIIAGLVVGLFTARIRFSPFVLHPAAILIGIAAVVLAAQNYADGATIADRLEDFRIRMHEWWLVVRAGDISNDNLPFVTLVHGVCFLAAYLGAWSIYRLHNPWLALIPGGIVLLANISFQDGQPSGAFIFFLFGAIVLIGRLYLQRNQARWKRQGVEYPDLISVSAVQLTFVLAVGLIVAAWLVPLGKQADAAEGAVKGLAKPFEGQSENFVRLFHNVDSRKGANLHTFGATLAIQGDVKLGTKILFEVKAGQAGLIRGTSYDEYTGAGWKSTDREAERVAAKSLDAAGETEQYEARTFSILDVTVKGDSSTVFSVGTPLSTNLPSLVDTPEDVRADIERIRSRRGLDSGDTYTAIGSQSLATIEQLVAAGKNYPAWARDRYLQLPKSLPARVRDETIRIIRDAGATTPYAQAEAIEAYLRTFPYDLSVPAAPPGRDAVDYLLFDLKRGYFDYQATAMAVMLRTQGVPARVAVGYVLDPTEAEETKYLVRKDDAYTWVEVYFPGYGWVEFNPTSDRPQGGGGRPGAGIVGRGDQFTEPDLSDLFPVDDPANLPGELGSALNSDPIDQKSPPWMLIYSLAGALVALVALLVAGRLTWNWGLGDLDGRARLWAKVQRLGGWAGMGPHPAETPREWSYRVGSAVDMRDDAVQLSDAYEEARYGRPDLQRIDDETASNAYTRLRNSLVQRVLRRHGPKPPENAPSP